MGRSVSRVVDSWCSISYGIKMSNNQMHVNECHRTLLQMSSDLRFANRLFALQRHTVALVSDQGVELNRWSGSQ